MRKQAEAARERSDAARAEAARAVEAAAREVKARSERQAEGEAAGKARRAARDMERARAQEPSWRVRDGHRMGISLYLGATMHRDLLGI